MALRWLLGTHLEFFWALVTKWLSGDLWRLILSTSGLWWPKSILSGKVEGQVHFYEVKLKVSFENVYVIFENVHFYEVKLKVSCIFTK